MNKNVIYDIFVRILRAEMCGGEPPLGADEYSDELLGALYSLSDVQDLANVVSRHLGRIGVRLQTPVMRAFQKKEMLAMHRCEELDYEIGKICSLFEENCIQHLPLKGAIIRPMYPQKYMRTSCDIDILVHEADLDYACDLLVGAGYDKGEREYHDVSLTSPHGVHLELHFSILENMPGIDRVLDKVWQYASVCDGYKYRMCLTDEFFLYHMLAHMSYHFAYGGCGMRAVCDLWIVESGMKINIHATKSLLEEGGIYTFACYMESLPKSCFGDEEMSDFLWQLLEYILSGGTYGSFDNKVAVAKTKSGNVLVYMLRRWLLPYSTLKEIYPVLKKAKILLPVFYLVRLFTFVFFKDKKRAMREIEIAKNTPEESVSNISEMLKKLEISQ